MIRSAACSSANDLSIRCRVRVSPLATNPKFEDAAEMICTMRHWVPQPGNDPVQGTFPNPNQQCLDAAPDDTRCAGPELVLSHTEIMMPISRMDHSPVTLSRVGTRQRVSPVAIKPSMHIPLSDIVTVQMVDINKKCQKVMVTTSNNGHFEFDDLNHNSRDVMLAFLQANMTGEQLVAIGLISDDDFGSIVSPFSQSSISMDVDKLVDEKMRRCSERESITERVSRRTSVVLYVLSDICAAICDSSCCKEKVDSAASIGKADAKVSPMNGFEHASHNAFRSRAKQKVIKLHMGELEEEESVMSDLLKKCDSNGYRKSSFDSSMAEMEMQRRAYRENLRNYINAHYAAGNENLEESESEFITTVV